MVNVKLFNQISPAGTERFDKSCYALSADAEEYEAVLVRSAKLHDTTFPSCLSCIARCGAGVNNIPVSACTNDGIVVFNTPGANANAVKELVLCGLFLASRKIVSAAAWTQSLKGQGEAVPTLVEKGKADFAGPEIMGKTLGIVGLGAIGLLVARTARHLGMKIIGYDPYISHEVYETLAGTIEIVKDLETVFQTADYITLHVPATEDTIGLVSRESIAKMKPGVRILNFSRGELVRDDDVIEAVKSGAVAAYVTDFASDALLGHDNITVLPHLGASTPESEDNCAAMAAQDVIDFLENGNIIHSVNYPNVRLPRGGGKRVGVCATADANVEALLREAGLTILAIQSKTRGSVSYTLAEVADIGSETADSLSLKEGVLSLRVID